jgi:hypothetical protein
MIALNAQISLLVDSLAFALDVLAQISHGQGNGKIHRFQQLDCQQVPDHRSQSKGACSRRLQARYYNV